MSHVATVKVEFKDLDVLKSVLKKRGINLKVGPHTIELYSGHVACDASFQLPGWRYPVAVVGEELKMDNFGGSWGKIEKLHEVQQDYTVEKARRKAVAMGYVVQQSQQADGSVQLEFTR